jgi:alkanesulfonate monooxygenase SsuD/methylene tetrahydromethanopterin reductase-like flavin-dependent oxidoreductase (luciferase family)
MREAWIDDGPDAAAAFAPVIAPVFRYYRRHGATDIPEAFGELADDRFVIGSAQACASQVNDIAARTGADIVVLTIRHPGGPSHGAVMDGIAALGEAWSRLQVAA